MRNYAVRLSAEGSAQMEQALRRVGNTGADAMTRLGSASRQASTQVAQTGESVRRLNSHQIQNAAFQIGDFAVQVQGGTRASVALAQQLPQLLGGFGALGAVLGAGAAIGIPLLALAFRTAAGAGGDLNEVLQDLESSASRADSIIRDLVNVQEAYAEAVAGTADAQGRATASIIADTQREFEAKKQLLLLEIQRQEALQALAASERAVLQQQIARETRDALPSLGGQAREQAFRSTTRTSSAGGDSIPVGIRTPFEFDRTRDLLAAGDNSESVRQLRELTAQQTLAEIGLGKLRDAARSTFATIEGGGGGAGAPADAPSGGRTVGGARGAARAVEEVGQAAETTTVDLRALAQEAARVEAANRALASTFGDLFTDAITGARSLRESLADLASDLGRLAINNAFLSLITGSGVASSGIGQAFGSLFGVPSFAGGGSTGMGPRSGGLDGRGGFLAMLHPQEDVIDRTRGQGAGVTVNFAPVINAQGADSEGLARVSRELQGMRAALPDMIQRAIRDPRARGAI